MIARNAELLACPGEELRALLAPIAPETLVADYWARRPLFIKGFAEKYQGLFDSVAFSDALAGPGPFPDDFLRASFDRKTDGGTSAPARLAGDARSHVMRITVEQAVPLFDAGATLCMSQVETRVPRLAPFLAAIKRQLGYPGIVSFNAYLSPPGSGFNWHFDSRIATTLQIEGSKVWRFSAQAALEWPRANGTMRSDGTPQYGDPNVVAQPWERLRGFDERATTEVLLEPGDLLMLPAGVWHEACGGSGGSLALNLSFTAISYTLLVRNLLDELLTPDAGWRGPAPLLACGDAGEIDPAGVAAIHAQLQRAATVLQSLAGDSATVVRMWEAFVQMSSGSAAPRSLRAPSAPAVTPATELRVRADGNYLALLADRGTRLCLTIGTAPALEVTGSALPFVQRILRERTFTAQACLAWTTDGGHVDWDDVAEILTSLVREGLLEVR